MSRYSIGQPVTCRVVMILSHAVLTKLEDETTGRIPARELSWDSKPVDPHNIVKLGQTINTKVIGLDDHEIKLSLRDAQHDPWETVKYRYKLNVPILGIVTGVMEYGAFVELEPGVTGLLHRSELSPRQIEKVEDAVLIGDYVEVVPLEMDKSQRHISLSILRRLEFLKKEGGKIYKEMIEREPINIPPEQRALLENLKERLEAEAQAAKLKREEEYNKWLSEQIKIAEAQTAEFENLKEQILLVDDEEHVQKSMGRILNQMGFSVDIGINGTEAIEKVRNKDYFCIVMDENLKEDMDGLQAMKDIKSMKPHLPIIMITGDRDIRRKPTFELNVLKLAHALMKKPVLEANLKEVLGKVRMGERMPITQETIDDMYRGLLIDENSLEQTKLFGFSILDELEKELSLLKQITKADKCALFKLDIGTREVSMVVNSGIKDEDFDKVFRELKSSPVRDVAEDREIIYTNDASRMEGKFEKMMGLGNFQSCIGIPLSVTGKFRYALFLLHTEPNRFSIAALENCKVTANIMSLMLERENQSKAIEKVRSTLIIGQLIAGIIHELNSSLGSISNYSAAALTDAKENKISEMVRGLDDLIKMKDQMNQSLQFFLSMVTGKGNDNIVDINKCIRNIVKVVRPTAEVAFVKINEDYTSADMPSVGISEIALQHIIMNLLLNSIQQIQLENISQGWVKIGTDFVEEDELPIKIRVSDNGPGIHKRDMEEVFNMSFTTRPSGAGLGLYICKELLKIPGGKISIEKSVIFIGTTFLVELPVYKSDRSKKYGR